MSERGILRTGAGSASTPSDLEKLRYEVAESLEAQAGRPNAKKPFDPREKAVTGGRILSNRPEIRDLPPDAPVKALGTYGNKLYFLDVHRQLRGGRVKDLNRALILHLFGQEDWWLFALWPSMKRVGEDWTVTGWDVKKAQHALMRAASRQLWEPRQYLRGRGAWPLEDGRLLVHSGPTLHLSDGKVEHPGLVGRHVYPAAGRALAPAIPGTTERLMVGLRPRSSSPSLELGIGRGLAMQGFFLDGFVRQ